MEIIRDLSDKQIDLSTLAYLEGIPSMSQITPEEGKEIWMKTKPFRERFIAKTLMYAIPLLAHHIYTMPEGVIASEIERIKLPGLKRVNLTPAEEYIFKIEAFIHGEAVQALQITYKQIESLPDEHPMKVQKKYMDNIALIGKQHAYNDRKVRIFDPLLLSVTGVETELSLLFGIHEMEMYYGSGEHIPAVVMRTLPLFQELASRHSQEEVAAILHILQKSQYPGDRFYGRLNPAMWERSIREDGAVQWNLLGEKVHDAIKSHHLSPVMDVSDGPRLPCPAFVPYPDGDMKARYGENPIVTLSQIYYYLMNRN